MTAQMTATQLKATILAVLDQVAAGDEIEITKHGRTVARLVPAVGPLAVRGRFADIAITTDPEDDLFDTGVAWDLQ